MKNPITTAQLVADDAFRNAFKAIARMAIPYMDNEYAYYTDLLHDAAQCARLAEGDRLYLLVRSVGTNTYAYGDDAVEYLPTTDGQAVLRIMRGPFDSFTVKVIYDVTARDI
jgi:hypothetical protein